VLFCVRLGVCTDHVIAGAVVVAGEFTKSTGYRLARQGVVVWEGPTLDSLKRFKDDVNKVAKGVEFGVGVPFGGVKVGDKLSSYNISKKRMKMEIKL
jgi:translation initiation factor IF-2